MPLISRGIILDDSIDDENYCLLIGKEKEPLYCILNEIELGKDRKRTIILGAFKKNDVFIFFKKISSFGSKSGGRKYTKEYKDLESCYDTFIKEFKKITENFWEGRENYTLRNNVNLFSFGEKIKEEVLAVNEEYDKIELSSCVLDFLKIILDQTILTSSLDSYNSDVALSGKCQKEKNSFYIPPDNISKAKSLLYKHYIDLIDGNKTDSAKITQIYYSLIPVVNKKIELIKDEDDIKNKIEELEYLENISFNLSIINSETLYKKSYSNKYIKLYESLGYNIIIPISEEFNMLKDYFYNSIGGHSFKIKLTNILKLENKEKEREYLRKYQNEYRELLFHGSPNINWISILKKGLLIDPSSVGAKITGKMFGNGIYWANCITKSSQYSLNRYNAQIQQKIIISAADVALGKQLLLNNNKTFSLENHNSVYAIGRYSYESYKQISPGLYIPKNKIKYLHNDCSLYYDEKIIYNQDRYLFKYLFICDANF